MTNPFLCSCATAEAHESIRMPALMREALRFTEIGETVYWQNAERNSGFEERTCHLCGSPDECVWLTQHHYVVGCLLLHWRLWMYEMRLTRSQMRNALYKRLSHALEGGLNHRKPLPNCCLAGVRGLLPDFNYTGFRPRRSQRLAAIRMAANPNGPVEV
jgi:hypothetical protein